jgi:hypothetical protein
MRISGELVATRDILEPVSAVGDSIAKTLDEPQSFVTINHG